MSKNEFKTAAMDSCKVRQEIELKQAMEGLKKMALLKNENCSMKNYMRSKLLCDVRTEFSRRTFMLPFADNYKEDGRFAWCQYQCTTSDTQAHYCMSWIC